MFGRFKKRNLQRHIALKLYNNLVLYARSPEFYIHYGVPDSELGRFEMICLHAYLLFKRLGKTDESGKYLSQLIHDLMFTDLDRTLREKGIGDMGIGKRIKTLARNLYGRVDAYDNALKKGDNSLMKALNRNLYATSAADEKQIAAMIYYVKESLHQLNSQSNSEIMQGNVIFPKASYEKS